MCYVTTRTVRYHSLTMYNVTSVYANNAHPLPLNIPGSYTVYGGGLYIYVGLNANQKHVPSCLGNRRGLALSFISISRSKFSHNSCSYRAEVWINCGVPGTIDQMTIEMRNNSGSSLFVTQDSGGLSYVSVIKDVTISDTVHVHSDDVGPEILESAVLIHRTSNTTFININIINSEVSALVLVSATVSFIGTENHFVNNS